MRHLAEIDGIEYGLLDRDDIPEMVRMIADVFAKHDPPAVALGLSAPEIEDIVEVLAIKALDEDVTTIAKTTDGKFVGAMLSEDFGTPPPDLTRAPAAFAALGAVLDELENEYRTLHEIVPGSDLHLFMLGVADAHGGKGVGQKLVELSVANGARRGYRYAFAEATGLVSQHIFRKASFRDRGAVLYDSFLFEGERVFGSITEHAGTILMVRDLNG
jgi:ribosomal protein S18 acetylase RimI-like enzyme